MEQLDQDDSQSFWESTKGREKGTNLKGISVKIPWRELEVKWVHVTANIWLLEKYNLESQLQSSSSPDFHLYWISDT